MEVSSEFMEVGGRVTHHIDIRGLCGARVQYKSSDTNQSIYVHCINCQRYIGKMHENWVWRPKERFQSSDPCIDCLATTAEELHEILQDPNYKTFAFDEVFSYPDKELDSDEAVHHRLLGFPLPRDKR